MTADREFIYSLGRNRYDVLPLQRHAPDLREFAMSVLSQRAPSKDRAGYISAAFGGNGRRCKDNALPRRWLPLDVDGVDPEVHIAWRLFASRWRGFGWPTASSTPQSPRERVLLELDEAVDRDDGIAIGRLLVQEVEDEFGAAVRIDRCTFRAEQPCFLIVGDVKPFYLLGEPLCVQTWLQFVQPPPPSPPPASQAEALQADARMRHVVDVFGRAGLLRAPLNDGKGYAVHCPWEATHTAASPANDSATALLFPSERNGWRGGFRCLHAHCDTRRLRDVLLLLAAVEKAAV